MAKYITLEVEVYIDDAFEKISTKDLAAELASRGASTHHDVVRDAIAQIRRGDTLDAITTLEREFWPKWASVEDSEFALRRATAPANDNRLALREAAPTGAVG